MVRRWPWVIEERRWKLCINARKIGKSVDPWCISKQLNGFHGVIFAWPCVLSDRPPVLWWLSPGEGWDAVINCKLYKV